MRILSPIVCGAVGHRWAPVENADAPHALLRCRRCRGERPITAEDRLIREQEHRLFWHDKMTPKDPLLDHRVYVQRRFGRRPY